MRITGLATGLDMDKLVTDSMKPYRIKIDKKGQQKDIIEIKQKLYREIIKDSRELYNKYFDITKSDSLLLSKNWATTKFQSSNENLVTVTGNSEAKPENYTITGTAAKANTANLPSLDQEIFINGQRFEIEGLTNKEKADNLNKALSNAKINVSVRYTEFAGNTTEGNKQGFILESMILGKDNGFVIGGAANYDALVDIANSSEMLLNPKSLNDKITIKIGTDPDIVIDFSALSTGATTEDKANYINSALKDKNIIANIKDNNIILTSTATNGEISVSIPNTVGAIIGKNGEFAKITGLTVEALKNNENSENKVTFKIGSQEITVDISDESKIKENLNTALSGKGYTADIDTNGNIKFTSTKAGSVQPNPDIQIKSKDTGSFETVQSISFVDGKDATSAKMALKSTDLNKTIAINGIAIDLSATEAGTTADSKVEYINAVLRNQGISVAAKVENSNIVLKSNLKGSTSIITFSSIEGGTLSTGGQDANIIIKSDKNGVYTHTGTSNTVTLDGVTFKFNGDIPENSSITINGKQDITYTKDKIVKFINDYNTLIEKLNKLTSEKRNRNFDPLTAAQKKEMSEDEIELWNEKVEQGQLSRDNDLTRISNSLKQSMRTLVDGSELNLEKIGIKQVSDYQGTKNGTFTIDENTLTKALGENPEEVMNLFIKSKPTDTTLSESSKYSKTGILQRIKDILYNETVTSSSALLKKVGYEGTVTAYNNALTKSIEEYEQKISDMETDFTKREQALYTKYANLETIMNQYNSQQSYLTQQLGLG